MRYLHSKVIALRAHILVVYVNWQSNGRMDLLPDLLVFDAVQGLESTLRAADLLNLPQSSVSRRYRQFSQSLRLELSDKYGSYKVMKGQCLLQEVRQVAQRFRYLHHMNRWAPHPALHAWIKQHSPALPGLLLPLPLNAWDDWLDQQLIDQVVDCKLQGFLDTPRPSSCLTLVLLATAESTQSGALDLGDWITVDGLEQRVQAEGWRLTAHSEPMNTTMDPLIVVSERDLPAAEQRGAKKVAELVISCRYIRTERQLDPLASSQRQQFENLLFLSLERLASTSNLTQFQINEKQLREFSL